MGTGISDSIEECSTEDFEQNILCREADNILVSKILKPISEDVLLSAILPYLTKKDLHVLTQTCKYFRDVYYNLEKEIRLSYSTEDKKVIKASILKIKRYKNLRDVYLTTRGAFYGLFQHHQLFSSLDIKKLDLGQISSFYYPVGRFERESNDPDRQLHQDMLKKILFSLSGTLEYLDISNFQGKGGNLFLQDCFEKCTKLNYLVIGLRHELDVPVFLPDFFSEEERAEALKKPNTHTLTLLFNFCTYSKYRPGLVHTVFDPFFHPDRINKMKGIRLLDCSIYQSPLDNFRDDSSRQLNMERKLAIINRFILSERSTSLREISIVNRFLPEQVQGLENLERFEKGDLRTKFEGLRKIRIWDFQNVYKFEEYCTRLEKFEGQLDDLQLKKFVDNNRLTLRKIVLIEKQKDEGEKYKTYNTNEGLLHLSRCLKLKYIKILMVEGGHRCIRKSGFTEEFMIEKKSIIPKKFQRMEIFSKDVCVGHFARKAGKVWTTSLNTKGVFLFFWHSEKENYSHSYNKNGEM